MRKITPLLGWIGFCFGIATAVMTPMYNYAIPTFICMGIGFLLCSLYIMFSTKYEQKAKWVNPGYTGILLNSTPILIALCYFLFPIK